MAKTQRTTTMVKTLHWDVIRDILCRLPVKDILRCRSVSRAWRSLIDDRDFINFHLNHNSNLGAVILTANSLLWLDLDYPDAARKLHNPIKNRRRFNNVLGSCNGLLALSNSPDHVVLWNPTTRRYRQLPVSDVDVSSVFFTRNFEFYGFGHDPFNDDYKLVRIAIKFGQTSSYFHSKVHVYSAKANSWKRNMRDFPYFINPKKSLYGVFAGKALHWIVLRKPNSDVSEFFVAFDLVTEEYHEILLPDYEKCKNVVTSFGVLGGSLCLVCNSSTESFPIVTSYRVDIWVMKECGVKKSWAKLFVMEESKAVGMHVSVGPVTYLKSGDQVLLNKNKAIFLLYDLQSKRAEKLRISSLPGSFATFSCMRSLVGLDGDWEEAEQKRRR